MRVFFVGVMFAIIAGVTPASADFCSDFQTCSEPPSPKAAIASCGRLIRLGRLGRYALSFAHFNRGYAFGFIGRYRKASELGERHPFLFRKLGR